MINKFKFLMNYLYILAIYYKYKRPPGGRKKSASYLYTLRVKKVGRTVQNIYHAMADALSSGYIVACSIYLSDLFVFGYGLIYGCRLFVYLRQHY